MELHVDDVEGIKVFSLPVTHIDAGNYEDIQELLAANMENAVNVILDLDGVEFIDSSGIGVILYCIRQLEKQGGKLRIANTNDTIRSAFELVRIDRLAEICETRFDAIAAFNSE